MFRKQRLAAIAATALGVLLLLPAVAAQADDPRTVEGEVIAVHQRVRTANQGEFNEITVRTQNRQEMRLRLGPAGDGAALCQVGDRVRARLVARGQQDGAYLTRRMQNRSTGADLRYRQRDGALLSERTRLRARDGSGDGNPDRTRARDRSSRPDRDRGAGRGAGAGRGRRWPRRRRRTRMTA